MTSSTNARSRAVHMWHTFAIVFVFVLLTGFTVARAPQSQAWTNGACATSNGVTVVVDFAGLGGGTTTRCAPGSQSSGVTALRNAGFSVGFVQQNSSQGLFVCRIDNKPSPASETCANTPPASASWSYWNASRGGEWRYSNAGAGNRQPPAGSVEGWRFNSGRPVAPSLAPPPPLPVRPTPKPTVKPTSKPDRHPTESASSTPNNGSKQTANSGSADADKSSAAGKKGAVKAGSEQTMAPTGPSANLDAAGVASDTEAVLEPSSPGGALAAVVIVALLGGGAAFAWSRRSREH